MTIGFLRFKLSASYEILSMANGSNAPLKQALSCLHSEYRVKASNESKKG